MTVTEPSTEPAFRHALRHIGNHGRASPHCLCGHCFPGGDYSANELALDACMTQAEVMVSIIESSTPDPHPSTRLSVRVLYELIDDARKLLCLQRQTARALASFRAR